MAVTNNWGPPSIAGTVDSTVDSLLGNLKDYQTGQALQNLPKTADGSIDYKAAAVGMLRTNPALAQQFMKLEELKALGDYRKESLDIQRGHLGVAQDNTQNIQAEGKIFHIGPNGQLKGTTDIETGVFTPAGAAAAPAQPQQPKSVTNVGYGQQPTEKDLALLQSDPGKANLFDEVYGPGSATRYLAGGGPADPREKPPVSAPAPPQAPQAPKPVSSASPILQPPPGLKYSERQEWMKNRIKEQSGIDNPELKKADDAINSGLSSLENLREIVKLNSSAFSGWGAELRGNIAANTGIGGKKAGEDTLLLQNKLTSGALETLRATFGGNPTEGERAILIKVQGSPGLPAAVRKEVFDDAMRLAARRVRHNQKYAAAMREGRYFDPTYTDQTPVD